MTDLGAFFQVQRAARRAEWCANDERRTRARAPVDDDESAATSPLEDAPGAHEGRKGEWGCSDGELIRAQLIASGALRPGRPDDGEPTRFHNLAKAPVFRI